MTAELTEPMVEAWRYAIKKSMLATDANHSEVDALCDAALRDVRARGQRPVGKMIESYLNEGLVIPCVDAPLPVGALLYTTPQPTYRDGLLAAAKVCDGYMDECRSMQAFVSRHAAKICRDRINALTDKEQP